MDEEMEKALTYAERAAGNGMMHPRPARECFALLAKEVRRQAAIISKLPVTSDGAPIVPGMRLWWIIGQMIDSATINRGGGISTWRDSLSFYNDTMASYCIPLPCTYSSKDAAAAALAVTVKSENGGSK